MKTHLPIALRKALLAAIFAVPVMTHSTAHADDVTNVVTVNEPNSSEAYTYSTALMSEGSSVKFNDGTVSVDLIEGQTTINSSGKGNINVKNQITGGDGTVLTSCGGTIDVGMILGTNTIISNTGNGTVKTSTIDGSGTQIETVNGDVTTDYISEKTTIKTQNGDVTTGMINTDDGSETSITTVNGDVTAYKISTKTTITSTGAGNIEITNGIEDTTDYADGEVGTSITSQGGNITIGKTETNGTISVAAVNGENTVISTTGDGTITTGAILGAGTQIETKYGDGAVSTGVIYGADTTIKTEDGAVTTVAISAADTTITSTGAGSIKVDGYIREAAEGTKITGAGGAITTSVIAGTNTKITNTGDGTIETGYISGDDTTITTEDGAVTTGGISGDDTTIDVVNGAVTTGDISGAGTQINTVDANVTTGSISGADTTITSTGAGAIKVNGNIQRTAEGTKITGAGGGITTREIAGTNTKITNTGDGTIETGNISGADTTIDVVNGAVTTGAISAKTTITSIGKTATAGGTGVGEIEVGAISGAGTQIKTEDANVTTGGISGDDTTITSTGAGAIKVNGNIQRTAEGTKITGAGGAITTREIAGSNTEITNTGDGTIETGNISGAGTQITAENGAVTTGGISADSLKITTEGGSVNIASINTSASANDEVDALNITTEGTGGLEIGLSTGDLANATLNIAGEIVLGGDTAGKSGRLEIRGMENKYGKTYIQAGGSITVNQTVVIHPGDGQNASGDVEVFSKEYIAFQGYQTTIQGGGSEAGAGKARITADEGILFKNAGGTTIADGAILETTEGKGGHIRLENGGSTNVITGDLDADGEVWIEGKQNTIAMFGGVVDIQAGKSITITATGGSQSGTHITHGNFIAEDGAVEITGGDGVSVSDSSITSVNKGVKIESGAVSVSESTVIASDTVGDVKIAGTDVSGNGTGLSDTTVKGNNIYVGSDSTKTSIGSMFDADANRSLLIAQTTLEVKGKNVNISGDTSVESENGSVTIKATGADDNNVPALNVQGGSITAGQDVTLSAAVGTAALTGVEIKGSAVGITGAIVDIVDNKAISTTDGNVGIEATNGSASVAGGSVTSTNGSVTISGKTDTTVDTTRIEGKVVNIGNDAATGTTKIQGGKAITAAEGVNITGAIVDIVDNTAISTTDGNVEIEATNGSASVAGGSVTSTNGDVTISGTTDTTVDTTRIEGKVVTISGTTDTTVDTTGIAGKVVNIGDDAATGTTTIQGGQAITATEGVNITGAIVDIVDNSAISTTDGNVEIEATNGSASVAGGSVTSTNGSVTISGTTDTTVKEGVQVQAGTDVTIDGGDTAANTITGADTLVDAAKKVDIYGATNTIKDGADVIAGTDVTLDAATSNLIEAGAVVTAETGEVAITGPTNTIDGAGTTVTGETKVTISGDTANTISGNAQVQAGTDVTIDGGDTAANTITGADTLVDAAEKVDIYGATNTIKDGADVIAGTDVTLDAGENNVVNGGAKVTAKGSVDMDAVVNNTIDASTVTAVNGTVSMGNADDTAAGVKNFINGAEVTAGAAVSMKGDINNIQSDSHVTAIGDSVTMTGAAQNAISASTVKAGTDVTIDGDTTAANTITGADTLVDAAKKVDIYGATNTIKDGADVIAGTDVTLAAATSNFIEAGAVVTAETGEVAITGPTNTIDGAGTTVTGETKVTITGGAANTISGNAQVQAETDVTIDGRTTAANTITGADTLVDAAEKVKIDGATNTIKDGADVIAGTDVTLDAATSNFIAGKAAVDAGGAIKVNAGEDNVISAEAELTALSNVTLTAADDNYITGDDTQLYAGGEVSLKGKNNTITDKATMIGMGLEGVKAEAEANNMITDGGKVFALNDNASVILTAGVVNQIAGASTVVYAGNDTRMTAETFNVIDAAKLTAMNGSLTMANAADNVVALVNSIQNGAQVAAGAAVSMKGAINNILSDSHVTAIDGSVTMTGATQNAISASTVKAGTDVKLDAGENNVINGGAKVTAKGSVDMDAVANNIISDIDTQVYAVDTVSIDGANNVVTEKAKVIGLKGVEITAGADNTINGGAQVLGYDDAASVSITAGKDNLIAGATTKVYAGSDVDLTAETTNIIYEATVTAKTGDITMGNAADSVATLVNSIQNGAQVAAGAAVSMKGAINNIQSDSHVTAIGGSVTMTGATQNAISESTVKAGTDVQLNAGENNVIAGASTVTATGKAELTADASNYITGVSELTAGTDVTIKGEVNNTIDASTVTAVDGTVSMGNANDTAVGVKNFINGAEVIAGEAVSMKGDINNIQSDSHVTAIDGSVTMTGATQNAISESTVKAGTDVKLDAGVNNVINGGSMLTAVGSVDMDAGESNIISDAGTQVYAGETVDIDGKNNIVTKDAKVIGMQGVEITAATDNTINAGGQVLAMNDDASVSISAGEDNLIAGETTKVYAGSDVDVTAERTNTIYGATVTAKTGDITMGNAAGNTDTVVNTVTAAGKLAAAYDVTLMGDKNAILAGSTVTAGMDVTLTADTQNAVANSAVTAKHGDITMGDVDGRLATVENVVTSEAGKTTTLKAGEDVSIMGYNVITAKDKGGTSITAENGNITIHDSNYIKYAVIDAEGDVSITTGTGDKRTWIEDTTISGETVTIAGDTTTTTTDRSTENLAVVKGSDTEIHSWGDDNGAGITLNNVSVVDTEKDYSNIKAHGDGDIVILNRVDVRNGTLSIDYDPSNASGQGRIVVDDDNVLNMTKDSSLAGRLTGTGDINKSGGDELLLDYDHTEFNGTIYANGAVGGDAGSVLDGDNAGSWIKITDTNVGAGQKAGVGRGASIVLKNTDLVISTTEARIGTLDTTQDTNKQNNAATGDTLLADGSYTTDDNLRADFTTVGSVLEVNMDRVGDSVKSSNLKLSDATLIKLNAAVAADGSASSDKIEALGTIDVAARAGLNSTSTAAAPSTARVYIRHNDKAATAAEGARTTIMQGTMVTDINEDVLYDVAASANGTYQRKLQERNVHLENKGDHVDLVYSKNYRSSDKTPQMQQVANALKQISDTFHHHEGTLAASSNRLHNLIDAFDYTRSEGAAQRGLQSVAGTANVLPRLMMFDASRRHLENLREQIQMPDCPDASGKAGTELRSSNAWMTYTGAYDSLNGDAYLDDYTRTGHGIMAGIDHSVRCYLRLGLSLGYEVSIGRAENARVDAETFFVDAYAAGVTGRFKHRASIGLATGSYDTERNVLVDAGYHTFVGKGEGSVDSLTVNFGYEISTDIDLNDSSWLTPYAALNLSWHSTDDLRESGMGEAGLVSSYGNEWQSELIFGVSYKHQFSAVPNQAPAMFYANAAMHLELFNDRVVLKNRFIGSPVGWRAESMNREPLYFELGAGVAVPLTPSWTATAGGSVEFGSERSGVSGNVGVRYQF